MLTQQLNQDIAGLIDDYSLGPLPIRNFARKVLDTYVKPRANPIYLANDDVIVSRISEAYMKKFGCTFSSLIEKCPTWKEILSCVLNLICVSTDWTGQTVFTTDLVEETIMGLVSELAHLEGMDDEFEALFN